jgi:hypothetical protein
VDTPVSGYSAVVREVYVADAVLDHAVVRTTRADPRTSGR